MAPVGYGSPIPQPNPKIPHCIRNDNPLSAPVGYGSPIPQPNPKIPHCIQNDNPLVEPVGYGSPIPQPNPICHSERSEESCLFTLHQSSYICNPPISQITKYYSYVTLPWKLLQKKISMYIIIMQSNLVALYVAQIKWAVRLLAESANFS